jgi:RNA polymerase sigma factor (sigma-70 family)
MRRTVEMGEVAGSRRTWNSADEPMPAESPTFEEFFEAEKDRLLRILSVITGSRTEAEDVAQEAFTRVFERWDTLSGSVDLSGYLHRTAMNVFRSRLRRAAIALRRTVMPNPEEDVFQVVDDRDLAIRALATLTPRQRAALVLTEVLGYSGEEAGRLLGIKASTVWALRHQARSATSELGGTTDV